MTAIDLLKQQHQEVRSLFEQLEQTEDPDEKQALFQELSDNLAAHATIEEKIFYPAAYANQSEELLTEALEEHLAMKRILADLLAMMPDDQNFDAQIEVLKEAVEHHVAKEEGEVFKAARAEIGAPELKRLGAEMKRRFDQELAADPNEDLPDLTDDATPLA